MVDVRGNPDSYREAKGYKYSGVRTFPFSVFHFPYENNPDSIFLTKIIRFPFYILLLSISIFASCTNDLKDVMALPRNHVSPSQVGDSVTMLYSDSSLLKVMVKANRMLLFDKNVSEPFTVLPRGVFVTFFDEHEKVSATLKANFGVRYDLTKKMQAKYKVEVVNREGVKLETEKLIWDELSKTIYTDAFVKITTDKEIIKGHGLKSNQDFTKYELKKVTGIIQIKNDEL